MDSNQEQTNPASSMENDLSMDMDMDMSKSDEDSNPNFDAIDEDQSNGDDLTNDSRDDYKVESPPHRDQNTRSQRNDDYRHRNDDHHESDKKRPSYRQGDSAMRVVQVLNISPSLTIDELKGLFEIFGDISEIKLYDCNHDSLESNFKVCFIEFTSESSVPMALNLTNTVFIDRALVVLPYNSHHIPTQESLMDNITGLEHLVNFDAGFVHQVVSGPSGVQMINTSDPRYTALGISQYPQLPIGTDPTRLEEIRRTVYIGNLDSTVSPDKVMNFFNGIGEVKYLRMAGDEAQPTRFAFVEYTHQSSIANVLTNHGFVLGSRSLKINHSNNSIVKPLAKVESDDSSHKAPTIDKRLTSREQARHHSTYRDRDNSRDRARDRDRYHDTRRASPRDSRSRRSRSPRRRSRSPHDRYRRKSPDRHSHRQDDSKFSERVRGSGSGSGSRNRGSPRTKRSRSRSGDRSRGVKHHKSSRR